MLTMCGGGVFRVFNYVINFQKPSLLGEKKRRLCSANAFHH